MNKKYTIAILLGLSLLLLGVSIFVTQHVAILQIRRGVFTTGTVMGFNSINETCKLCSSECYYYGCDCDYYPFTGTVLVSYTPGFSEPGVSNSSCETYANIPKSCAKTAEKAVDNVRDSYQIGYPIEGYSLANKCNFLIDHKKLTPLWVTMCVLWILFLAFVMIAVFKWKNKCCFKYDNVVPVPLVNNVQQPSTASRFNYYNYQRV